MTETAAPARIGDPKTQILEAATGVLLRQGYSGASLRTIAAEAGLPLGNVQYYFPSKAQLMIEVWRYVNSRSLEQLRSELDRITDPASLMEIGPDQIWDSLKQLSDLQLVAYDLLVQAPKDATLRAFLPELFEGYRKVIEEQLDRFETATGMRLRLPRDVVVPLLMNTILGFGLYYVVTQDEASCDRALAAFRLVAASMLEAQ
ncbi:MAG TPA: TetR/AcrR family transcriptional regulator [Candidatus Dormibacteraeota bacterium]|jgi:AcrR family transcriptional regulator|nr:TetR/AcrR family transcriptional regulator [Candidatus Dormibacteraeota bacterium]